MNVLILAKLHFNVAGTRIAWTMSYKYAHTRRHAYVLTKWEATFRSKCVQIRVCVDDQRGDRGI